jgi:type VI secretion system protein ImpL
MIYAGVALAYSIYFVLAWLLGGWLRPSGQGLWLLRAGLWLLGAVAAGACLWWKRAGKPRAETLGEETRPHDDLALLLEAADAKLTAAKLAGGSLADAPVVLVMGLPGSCKTSVVANSGLDPELLAGKMQQDGSITATRGLNVWFGAGTVLVEAAGGVLADPRSWAKLVARLAPARFGSMLRGGAQAPRAALVCFDLEMLFRPGANPATQARLLRARLGDLAENLGAPLPVYALFTRADRVPFFQEYVNGLSKEEASRVLGATLPLGEVNPGLYGEEQSARLGRSFEDLFASLSSARLEILSRATEEHNAGAAYEFPREFRKLRTAVCDFLVDLCRPSQFAVGPVLRGFYFTGVRPVVQEVAVSAAPVVRQSAAPAGATAIFRTVAAVEPEVATPAPSRGGRRVPQWLFLPQLFRGVILADRAAMGASSTSTRTARARRWLFAGISAVSLLLAGMFTSSWARNRSLEEGAITAARQLPGAQTDSLEALRRLDVLRDHVERLAAYQSDGAPFLNRWGLYRGNALYPELRHIYFERFRDVLLDDTQKRIVETLRALPAKPGPAYGPTYDSLKAYLITTSNHERSTRAFLAPVLLDRWNTGRNVDPEKSALAARQFGFYADALRAENPYTDANDGYAVDKARDYLAQFSGAERVYRAMLAEAAKAAQPIEFNRQYPGSAATVVDPYAVGGAYTKAGWAFMQDAIRNPDRYFSGEQWVLGDRQGARLDGARLETELRTLYESDFAGQWRTYLKSASVVRYANLTDAGRKLGLLSGNDSALLALLSLASQHTAIDSAPVAAIFQPVHSVTPPASERLIGAPNQAYMSALLGLQSAVEQASAQGAGAADSVAAPVLAAAASAKMAARQLAQGFKPDPAGRIDATVAKLLEDPITGVESLLRVLGPEELNAKGAAVCAQMRPLLAKFPFDPNAAAEATVGEVNAVFRKPDGALWTFYETNLKKLVVRQGAQFAAAPGAPVRLTPAFLSFWNQAAAVSDALYAGGGQDPDFTFTLRPVAATGIQSLTLLFDGQQMQYSGGAATPKQFRWQAASSHEAKASVRFGSGPDLVWSNSQGPWAMFHFFYKAERWQGVGPDYRLEWTIRIGKDPVTLPSGETLTVPLELNVGNLAPVLQKGYLGRFACVGKIAQ